MWRDMPRPRAYQIRLSERVTRGGNYVGSFLHFDSRVVKC